MKFVIQTLGCKLNQFESEAIAQSLRKAGHEIAASERSADAVVVNTCTVTNRADVKCRQAMRQAKRAGKFVVATGCYATTDAEALASSGYIDLVVSNANKFRIAEFLPGTTGTPGAAVGLNDTAGNGTGGGTGGGTLPEVTGFERTRAFLKIQDGCDKFCSYCKVPYARGRSTSFPASRLVESARRLVENGYRELVLTGVNISAYRDAGTTLAGLVELLLDLDGDYRLRLSSIQPDEFEARLISFLPHPHFASHFHLSLQSGSDRVLKDMNRHYTRSDFLATVEAVRSAAPDCGITTDIIVGFPTETEADFADTLDLVRRCEFTRVHRFVYSPRAGTRAAKMPDLSGLVKKRRESELKAIDVETALRFAEREILGKPQTVLVEKSDGKESEGYTSGYFRFAVGEKLPENSFTVRTPLSTAVDREGVVELR